MARTYTLLLLFGSLLCLSAYGLDATDTCTFSTIVQHPSRIRSCKVLCKPATWVDVATFYVGNYIAHVATLRSEPGESTIQGIVTAIIAAFFPAAGLLSATKAIVSAAVLAKTPLRVAAKAGALYMVVKEEPLDPELASAYRDWKPYTFWKPWVLQAKARKSRAAMRQSMPGACDHSPLQGHSDAEASISLNPDGVANPSTISLKTVQGPHGNSSDPNSAPADVSPPAPDAKAQAPQLGPEDVTTAPKTPDSQTVGLQPGVKSRRPSGAGSDAIQKRSSGDDARSSSLQKGHDGLATSLPNDRRVVEIIDWGMFPKNIHGRVSLPPDWALTRVPPNAAFVDDGPLKAPSPKASSAQPSARVQVAQDYSFTAAVIALAQALYAISTLYNTTRYETVRFGYVNFGFTVIPYLFMSIVNLLANLICPTYSAVYIVENETLQDLRAQIKREDKEAIFYVEGTVGELAGPAQIDSKVHLSRAWARARLVYTVLVGLLYVMLLAIIGGLSQFHAGESTLAQRVWIMLWLIGGPPVGVFVVGLRLALALEDKVKATKVKPATATKSSIFWTSVCGIAAVGAWVVVGQMILQAGVCEEI